MRAGANSILLHLKIVVYPRQTAAAAAAAATKDEVMRKVVPHPAQQHMLLRLLICLML